MADNPQAGRYWRPDLLAALDAAREARRLAPLTMNKHLNPLAQAQAKYCVLLGRLTHDGPDGSDVFGRVSETGYDPAGAAEVLMPGTATAVDTVRAWLRSPPHRRQLLSPVWRHVGLGKFEKGGSVVWCALFGRPRE